MASCGLWARMRNARIMRRRWTGALRGRLAHWESQGLWGRRVNKVNKAHRVNKELKGRRVDKGHRVRLAFRVNKVHLGFKASRDNRVSRGHRANLAQPLPALIGTP